MSRTFSTNCGSADSLKVSIRCDCNPNVCQMRAMVALEKPATSAMLRVVHWVASAGGPSSVRVMMSTTRSSVALRGAPGRGSSVKPGRRRTRNRSRHLHTLLLETRSRLATARLVNPSAQARTIRDRDASRCAEVGRRAHCSKVRRSSSVSTIGLWWRFLGMPRSVPVRQPKYKTFSETRH